ncbi:MAG TPA: alpha/beta hydrolase-fold protein [Gemmatimonadaceae bacterium]|nr:alpha/beta hydrolase-fold protein [Gemmatimonadaceae bacterium]
MLRTLRPLVGVGLFVVVATLPTVACDPSSSTRTDTPFDSATVTGRLTARVAPPTGTVQKGLTIQTLTAGGRPFGLFVPSSYDPSTAWPVTVLLHGEGGSGEGMVLDFQSYAEAAGVVLLAPNSRQTTWDLLVNDVFGADRSYIDSMLKWAFAHIAVDSTRVSISGFSYGATYALWLGLKNGDLFSRIAAFTPCSTVPHTRTGMPTIFLSHGLDDKVALIDSCSRLTVPTLQDAGYSVQFVEYHATDGNGHYVTPEVLTQGMAFLAQR